MKRLKSYGRVGGFALLLSLLVSACGAPAATTAPQATAAPTTAATAAATAATTAGTATPVPSPLPGAQEGKFVYWGGLIFSDVANKMLVDRINQWGKEKGIQTEVVMINQNETTQRVSAAIEAGTLPDAFDAGIGFVLLLSPRNVLEPVDDVYKEIGDAHGGWTTAAAAAVDPKKFGGKIYGVPFGTSGNVLYRRADLTEPKGFKDAPKTWEELGEMAKAINNPPKVYGMGFALSNVGDGNLMMNILQAWGGRIADDTGKTCTIDSPETRAFMTWVTDLYKAGVFPPGATTWDGAGDNTAYQSGQAGFIANPGSVYLNIKQSDPELTQGTKFSALPAGPKMRIVPQNPNVRVISASSKNKDLAKDLFKYLSDDKFMEDYYNNAIYGPVLNGHKDFKIFKEGAVHVGLLDLALNGTPPNYPDVDNAALNEFNTNFLVPKMIQRVVVDNKSIDDAIKEAQGACQAIYDKYK
jgi:multiple sugar transport system substrate-binding protein